MININCIVVGMIDTNCYIVYDDERKEAVITDPGDNGEYIAKALQDAGLTPVAIFLTHCHFDHIRGIPKLREAYPDVPIYVHEEDVPWLTSGGKAPQESSAVPAMATPVPLTDIDVVLKGGEKIEAGGMTFEVISTPGHTPGCVCYYCPEGKFLLSGDTMFYHTWGATHFPGGDEKAIMESIRTKLLPLPADTAVLPGHENTTTIGEERKIHGFIA